MGNAGQGHAAAPPPTPKAHLSQPQHAELMGTTVAQHLRSRRQMMAHISRHGDGCGAWEAGEATIPSTCMQAGTPTAPTPHAYGREGSPPCRSPASASWSCISVSSSVLPRGKGPAATRSIPTWQAAPNAMCSCMQAAAELVCASSKAGSASLVQPQFAAAVAASAAVVASSPPASAGVAAAGALLGSWGASAAGLMLLRSLGARLLA